MSSLLDLNDGQREAVARAVEVIKQEIEPNAAHIDRNEEFPEKTIRGLGKHGLLGVPFPLEYGGTGLDLITYCSVMEEMGKVCASTASTVDAHTTMVGLSILQFGSDEQREKYLPQLASGAALGAFALTEPNAGSDVAGIETSAVKDGGGRRGASGGSGGGQDRAGPRHDGHQRFHHRKRNGRIQTLR